MSLAGAMARAAAELTAPLAVALEGPDRFADLLAELGWRVTLTAEQMAVLHVLLPVAADLEALLATADQLADGTAEAGDQTGAAITLAGAVLEAVDGLRALSAADVAALPAPLDVPATWAELADALIRYLLVTWLRLNQPLTFALLALSGVVTSEEREVGLPPRHDLAWDAFGRLLADPAGHLAGTYGWGGELAHQPLLMRLGACLRAAGVPAGLAEVPATVAEAHFAGAAPAGVRALRVPLLDEAVASVRGHVSLGLIAVPIPAAGAGPGGAPSRILVSHDLVGRIEPSMDLGGGWVVDLEGGAEAAGTLGVIVSGAGTELAGGPARPGVALRVSGSPALAWPVLGEGSGTRLELRSASLELAVGGTAAAPELRVMAGSPDGLALVIEPADPDSFVAGLLGDATLSVETGLLIGWSSRDGLTVAGQTGFEVTVALDRQAGPVRVERLDLRLVGGADGCSATVTVTGSAALGPLVIAVEGIGLALVLTPVSGRAGNLGSADLSLAFKPLDGLGLAIDIGVIGGGGYLWVDPEGGGYAGVLQVELLGVGISAVALIDTDVPVVGWSFFLGLFIDVPAIQLGFGFTLTGVGGLAGINRGLDTEALRAAVLGGAIDAVLFPDDPIAEAAAIVAALEAIFPSEPGRYTFGPVLRLGWGTPALVEATLGVVISLPDPISIAVLGSVTSVLPTAELDLIALRLDVAGFIDSAAGTLEAYASLHDSHVIGFALAGDMALYLDATDLPAFLMALGGFHPGFDDAPPGFPELRRLSLAIDAGPVIQIHFECYLALTSNTAQFGARLDLSATVEGFGVEGDTEFDALIEFSPLRVTTQLGFHVAITAADVDLAGAWLDVEVSGPNPWHVVGDANFRVLGIETPLHVDERIGAQRPEPAVAAANARELVREALAAPGAWSVVAVTVPGVALRAVELAPGELVADPAATLRVRQRAVPLGVRLDRVGEASPGAYDRFTLSTGAGALAASGDVQDWFALGHFLELGGAQALSAPSFELLPAGLELGGGAPSAGSDRRASLAFEQILLDPELAEAPARLDPLAVDPVRHPATIQPRAAGRPAGYAIARAERPVRFLQTGFALTDDLTGAVLLTRGSWAGCHQSVPAGAPGRSVVPAWESAA